MSQTEPSPLSQWDKRNRPHCPSGTNGTVPIVPQRLFGETYMIGWGYTVNDGICMSVYDFEKGEELMSVELGNPKNFTYRCVYYE